MTGEEQRQHLEGTLAYIRNFLNQLDGFARREQAVYDRYASLYRPAVRAWTARRYWFWAMVVLGPASTVLVLVLFMASVVSLGNTEMAHGAASVSLGAQAAPLGLWLIPVPFAFIGAGIIMTIQRSTVTGRNRKRAAHNQALTAQVEQRNVPELTAIRGGYTALQNGYAHHIGDWFPHAYLNDDAVGFCLAVVRNHRAYALPDALNLYEQHRAQRRLENLAQQRLDEARQQTQAIRAGNMINLIGHAATFSAVTYQGNMIRDRIDAHSASTASAIWHLRHR